MKKLITLNETVEVLERLVSSKQISRTKAFNMLLEHKRFLDQPLTKEIVEGDNALLVGFKVVSDKYTANRDYYFNGVFLIGNIEDEAFLRVWKYSKSGKYNGGLPYLGGLPCLLLHDLAELTKKNQLELK
jgi:hypothetical protein